MEATLSLTTKELSMLRRIITQVEKLIKASAAAQARDGKTGEKAGKRIRRSGQELVKFRKLLKAERRKGLPVAKMARRHGVSTAYIYNLP